MQSFEKLRQVRRNLGQAQSILEALIKREEKKRDVMDSEVSLQRIQLQYRHETELLEDSLAMPGFQPTTTSYKFGSSDDELMDSDDHTSTRVRTRPAVIPSSRFTNLNLNASHPGGIKQEVRRRQSQHGWLHRLDPNEPVMLFTKPLVPDKLAAAGIVPPTPDSSPGQPPSRFQGRIGRGGRIIFDRWNPLMQSHINCAAFQKPHSTTLISVPNMLSLYEASVPSIIKNLEALAKFLSKGSNHPAVTHEQLLNSRLYPDMGNLIFQIQKVSDFSKNLAVRAGKLPPVVFEDNEKTIDDLQERIRKTINLLQHVNENDFVKEDEEMTVPIMGHPMKFTGKDFTLNFTIPNVYFHTTIAYGLLRKEGVDVGKRDFLGAN